MFIRLSSTCSRFHPSLFASPSVSRSRTFFTLGSASGLKLSHPFDDSPPSTSPSVGCSSCGKKFLADDPIWTAKRFARRSVIKDRRIVDFLRAARIRMHGLISPETRLLIARRKEAVLKNVAATREKVRRKIVVVRENIWTLPNIICWMRIAAAPYLGYLIIQEDYRLALYLFVVAGLSDLADGFIARTFKSQRTQFGSFLDPAADKVLVACTFLPLAAVGLVPWYLSSVVIGRDVCLVAAGFYVRYMSLPPPITFSRFFEASRVTAQLKPTYLSKANTGLQLSLIVATLATHSYEFIDPAYLFYLCNITFVTTVASGLDYAIRSRSTYKLLTEKRVAGGSGKTR